MSSYTRQQLETWLKNIEVDETKKVIDIGGAQNPITKRVKTFKTKDYFIMDLPEPHEDKVIGGNRIIADIQEPLIGKLIRVDRLMSTDIIPNWFDNNGRLGREVFDIVFCLEVSEYWLNPIQALENINFLLKKGGSVFISFHFLYPVHRPIDADCLRYTRPGVRKLLEKTGFKIKDIVSRTANNDPNLFYRAEGMKPAQGYDFHREVGVLIEAIKIL